MRERRSNTVEYLKGIKESPEKMRSYLFFIFSVIVTIVLIVFAVRPTIVTITRINSEIRQKTRTNELLANKISALSDLDKEYTPNKEHFDNLELIFPADDNFSLFLANIEAVVTRNGFSLNSLSFSRYRGTDYNLNTRVLVPYTVSFSVSGRQRNIITLMRDLESLPMYPVIESISFSPPEEGQDTGSFSIHLRVYRIENDQFYK